MKQYFTFAPGILASCRPTASWLCGGSGRSPWGHHPGSLCRSAHPQPVTVSKHTSTSHRRSQSANIPIHLTDCHSQQTYQYITQTVTVSKHTSTSQRLTQCKYLCIFCLSQSVNIPVHLRACHSQQTYQYISQKARLSWCKVSVYFCLSRSVNIPVHLPDCHSANISVFSACHSQ